MPGSSNERVAGPVPILLMVRRLDLGGSERQLAEAVTSLDRSRFTPHVGCFDRNGMRGEELRGAGAPIVEFPVRSFYAPQTLAVARQLGRYIHRNRIQLVHTFDVPTTLFGVPAARVFRAPIVVSSQRAHRSLVSGVARKLLRITDRIVDGVVVNCEAMKRHLIDDEHVPPDRIHLCPNGVDTSTFRPKAPDSSSRLADAPLVVGTVCALRPEKAVALLLDAFARVRSACPGAKLVIVGDGPSRPALELRCADLGLLVDCEFHPATAQVAEWLRAIDIFVLPSNSEALSNALMEAMACGCAVVASRVGGNPELVRHGCNGLLFARHNVAELTTALRLLIDQPSLRAKVGAAAARFIREHRSTSVAARRLAGIYSSLLAARH